MHFATGLKLSFAVVADFEIEVMISAIYILTWPASCDIAILQQFLLPSSIFLRRAAPNNTEL